MKVFCVLWVLCGISLSAFALDREAFTFTKYDLQIQLEPEQSRLGARGKITLRNDSAQPQKIAVLQISSSLGWRSIQADGKTLQFVSQPFASDIDHTGALSEAIITLPAQVKPEDSIELEVAYEGTIPLDSTRLTQIGVPEVIARHASWDQITPSFTAVRGVGYVAWYPISTESADFTEGNSMFQVANRWKRREASSEMNISACSSDDQTPPDAVLMGDRSPGVRGGSGGGSDHHPQQKFLCVLHRFEPAGIDAPTFAFAKFKKQTAGGSPLVTVHSLDNHDSGATTYLIAASPSAKFVTEWFGSPTTPIAIADLADPHAAPFESGMLLLTSMEVVDPKLAQINLTHELVHSAFLSPRPWIYEGLAHFAEAVYREKQDGRQAALMLLGVHRAAFVDPEKAVAGAPQKNPGEPLSATFDEIYYRSKAAYVWWMLRDMIGEASLKQAIHNYRPADDKDPKYMEQLLTAASKRDLGWFFDDWVYHDRGLPDLHVQSVHPWKNENGTQIITVTFENLGSAGAEVPYTVRFDDGEITRRIEIRAKSTATTRIELPGAPLEVIINDGSVPETEMGNNAFRIVER